MAPASAETRRAHLRTWRGLAVRVLFLTGSLVLILRRVELDTIMESLRRIGMAEYVLATLGVLLRGWLTAVRWHLVSPDNDGRIRLRSYFRYILLSNTFNLVMPGALGGDVLRGILVTREIGEGRTGILMAILADRTLGLTSIVAFGILACLLQPALGNRLLYFVAFSALGGGLVIATWAVLSEWPYHLLERLSAHTGGLGIKLERGVGAWKAALAHYRRTRLRVALALALCIPIHLMWFVAVFILARSMGIQVTFLGLAIATSIVWVITALPISFAGLGVREVSFAYFLVAQNVPLDDAIALSLGSFSIMIILGIASAPLLLVGRKPGETGVMD